MKKLLYLLIAVMFVTATHFFWEVALPTKAAGSINPSTITSGNIFVIIWGKSSTGGNIWIGCPLKANVDGTWTILNNSTHEPVGCNSITQDSTSITINHTAMSQVTSSSFTMDGSSGVVGGYNVGASVGLDHSIITVGN